MILRPTSIFSLLALCACLLVSACNSVYDATGKNVEDIFKQAVKEFNDEDMLEAQRLFDIIKLQYPASGYADDAQYYIAEINFKRKEFILAAFNYNFLRRSYPQSEHAKDALYKAALCYVELSPPFDREQKYTREAIASLSDFQKEYPKDSLSTVAGNLIKDMRNKLAEREYRVAEQYRVLYSPKASLVYYDAVIDEYADTKFAELSFVGKTEVLVELKRYDEAVSLCTLYSRFFPDGTEKNRIEELRKAAMGLNASK